MSEVITCILCHAFGVGLCFLLIWSAAQIGLLDEVSGMAERKMIYLDDAIRIVERFYKVNEDMRRNMAFELRQLPTAQQERKKAIDIFETVIDHHCEFKCSLCGKEIGEVWLEHSDDFNYCPFCGADMRCTP